MAESIKAKMRVAGIDFSSNPIKDKVTALAATWVGQPKTLRDDELTIVTEAPDEDPVYCHEHDNAIDNSFTGKGQTMTGSFVNMTAAQLVALVGGKLDGTAYEMTDSLLPINTAVRIRFHGGGWLVFPKVKGYVTLDLNVGVGGRVKAPFKFTPVVPNAGAIGIWETDTSTVVAPPAPLAAPLVAPMSAPVVEKTETKK
ncbi:MAG: hypothetical protein RL662_2121 [Bacteroidota bacterium]|jgi:hypothetical protein